MPSRRSPGGTAIEPTSLVRVSIRQTRQGPPSHQKTLPPSGLLQVRLVGGGQPVRIRPQTRVDRFLSSPQRVDVGTIGGEAGPPPRTPRNRAGARGHHIHVAGGRLPPVA